MYVKIMDEKLKVFSFVVVMLSITALIAIYISFHVPYPNSSGNYTVQQCEKIIRESISESKVNDFCQSKGYNYGDLKVDVLCVGLKSGELTYKYFNVSEVVER